MSRYYVRNGMHYGTADEMIDCIDDLDAQALANRVAIMRLEAKLAKAVETLNFYATLIGEKHECPWHMLSDDYGEKARTTLAELTGGKDE